MKQLPEPRYLNLEYLFNNFFEAIRELMERMLEFAVRFSSQSFKFSSVIISIILFFGILMLLYKIASLRRKKIVHLADFLTREEIPEMRVNHWAEIEKNIESENSADWKMAIIEADSIIDSIIQRIGYKGENLGERLKNIEPSDFENLQNVWEAHKVRNRIAHEAEGFELTKEEAGAVLEKYKKALRELKYI